MPRTTPSQTVGPYLDIGLSWLDTAEIAGVPGERVRIRGRMTDGDGKPIADGMLEIWQADPAGKLDNPAFRGFGRVCTKTDGSYAFSTIRPGRIAAGGGRVQAPHLLVGIFARGLLKRAATRMYFPGDAHGEDPVLSLVDPARRPTLVAKPASDGALEWNVVLQGPGETVFFDL